MINKTIPIFIVGSGRNGTRLLYKLLSGISGIEAHHEYLCTHIQPLAAKYYMGMLDKHSLKKEIMHLHGAGIFYTKADYFIDSSNKLSWIIEPLYELFPTARFIHLLRDGRKVASSFFHKLSPEIYDNESVSIMQNWIKNKNMLLEPPPEKRYWWNIPQGGQPFADEFAKFDQFQRICYHWVEIVRVIDQSFKKIPKRQQLTVKLEEITKEKKRLKELLSFMSIEYNDDFYRFIQRPQNVFTPIDFKLTNKELEQFNTIAGITLKRLGYTKDIYEVKY